jgi:hypothetical protein
VPGHDDLDAEPRQPRSLLIERCLLEALHALNPYLGPILDCSALAFEGQLLQFDLSEALTERRLAVFGGCTATH